MTRRDRQLDELRALCAQGRVARAIDLAFEHVACFGPDRDVFAVISAAVEHDGTPSSLTRLRELDELVEGPGPPLSDG